jgi:hypothetical protein
MVTVWDGGYDLTVNISTADVSPKWVYCLPCAHRDEADLAHHEFSDAQKALSLKDNGWGKFVQPFDGQPIQVFVWLSGRSSTVFGELSETQFGRYLVVIAEMPDGTRVGKIVNIPDHKQSREVSVTIP